MSEGRIQTLYITFEDLDVENLVYPKYVFKKYWYKEIKPTSIESIIAIGLSIKKAIKLRRCLADRITLGQ